MRVSTATVKKEAKIYQTRLVRPVVGGCSIQYYGAVELPKNEGNGIVVAGAQQCSNLKPGKDEARTHEVGD